MVVVRASGRGSSSEVVVPRLPARLLLEEGEEGAEGNLLMTLVEDDGEAAATV